MNFAKKNKTKLKPAQSCTLTGTYTPPPLPKKIYPFSLENTLLNLLGPERESNWILHGCQVDAQTFQQSTMGTFKTDCHGSVKFVKKRFHKLFVAFSFLNSSIIDSTVQIILEQTRSEVKKFNFLFFANFFCFSDYLSVRSLGLFNENES